MQHILWIGKDSVRSTLIDRLLCNDEQKHLGYYSKHRSTSRTPLIMSTRSKILRVAFERKFAATLYEHDQRLELTVHEENIKRRKRDKTLGCGAPFSTATVLMIDPMKEEIPCKKPFADMHLTLVRNGGQRR